MAAIPNLFGSKVREGWPEVADFNDNIMKVGLAGETLAYRDFPLTLYRHGGKPEQVWLNLDYSPLLGEDGRPAGVMAIVVEITDKVRIERELEAERKSLKLMFEQAPGLIAMLSGPEHRFTMVNEAYRTLVAARDVVGRTVAEALPEVVEQGFVGLLDPVYASGEPHIGRGAPVNLQHGPDGVLVERYLDFIYQPIVAGDGATTGIFIQGHDVTEQHETEKAIRAEVAERRRAEEALQVLNNTLEQRVHDEVSARSKVEEQLRQVQKMEAVGQLTGGIAHDFNNMLAVIMGGLDLLKRKLARGETDVERFIEGAIDGAQRAATLTQRLLAFSRQQPLSPEPLIINKRVAGMSELLDRTLGEQVKVETVLAAGLWQVKADPAQLENAILNLAVNARDAMPGGGRLTIETQNAFVDDAYAAAIRDRGRTVRADRRRRHRRRHGAGGHRKGLRSLLHHQRRWKGDGSGPQPSVWLRSPVRGPRKVYSEPGVGTSVRFTSRASMAKPRRRSRRSGLPLSTAVCAAKSSSWSRTRNVCAHCLSKP